MQKEHLLKNQTDDSAARIFEIDQIIRSKQEDEKFVFMHRFHTTSLQKGVDLLTNDVKKYEKHLMGDYAEFLSEAFDSRVEEFYANYFLD